MRVESVASALVGAPGFAKHVDAVIVVTRASDVSVRCVVSSLEVLPRALACHVAIQNRIICVAKILPSIL